jgi:hypothetical protein
MLWRVGGALIAAAFIGGGFLALSEHAATAGLDGEGAAAAQDGRLRVSGMVANVYEESAPSATFLTLRGAPGLTFHFDGAVGRAYAIGDFVTIEGTKSGSTVEGDSMIRAVEPLRAALPHLLVGLAVAGMLVLDFVVPFAMKRGFSARALGGRLKAPFRRLSKRQKAEREGGPGAGDNHSGAPAPKG